MAPFERRIRKVWKSLVRPHTPSYSLLLIHPFPSLVQCIGEAFGVDPADKAQANRLSVKPATLQTIFEVYLKTKDKINSTVQPASSTAPAASASLSAEDKAAAEKHKQEGNAHMTSKQYDEAIDAYTKAIERDPSNPVYFSNRAAAHSSKSDHLSAVADAEQAIELDPKFVRGYSRLGCRVASFQVGISLLTPSCAQTCPPLYWRLSRRRCGI
jgi:tetratricopeptide (TPR) repeat protein